MEFCKNNFLIVSCANKHEFILSKINRSGKDAADIEHLRLCENHRYLYELSDICDKVTETCKTCTNESCSWNKGDFEALRNKCDDIINHIKEMADELSEVSNVVEEIS